MEGEKIFKTKTGFCHVFPDKIVLTRDGIVGNISEVMVGNKISKILLIYCSLSIYLFYSAFEEYRKERIFQTIMYSLLGFFLIFGVIKSINNSAASIIYRDKIKKVKFKKAITGLTRSRFEVFFEDEKKKIKKRLIMLPGSLTGGKSETEIALEIMKNEKLIINL